MIEYVSKEGTARLIARRLELKMPVYILAEKLGYKSTDRVKAVESGDARIPLSRLPMWCKALQIAPEKVIVAYMKGDEEEKDIPVNSNFHLNENKRLLRIEGNIRKMTDKEFDMLVEFADMLVRYHNYI